MLRDELVVDIGLDKLQRNETGMLSAKSKLLRNETGRLSAKSKGK